MTSGRNSLLMAIGLTAVLLGSVFAARALRRTAKYDARVPSATSSNAQRHDSTAIAPRIKGQNPFAGVALYVNAYGAAANQVKLWEHTRPVDAQLLQKIATQPTGWWLGDWSRDIESAVRDLGSATNSAGVVPVLVAYNIPSRDCGQHSRGGSASTQEYRAWIRRIATGAGSFRMIVVLEPDAVPMLAGCLTPADQAERLSLIRDSVEVLEASPGLSVYIDAGHPDWIPPEEMARRLKAAGIDAADGFSLNIANYIATDLNIEYGHAISKYLGDKHFIIDTSRNGNGATFEGAWCNPKGRALGIPPTTNTGDPLVDAFFWIKPPGESDGECNGGPKAGTFWLDQALELATLAKWTLPKAQATGSVEVP